MADPDAINRMQAAKSLGNTLHETFMILEASYVEQIIESPSDDEILREHIYHRLRIMKDMETVLMKIVADGQIAEADIMRKAQIDKGELKEFF